MTKGKVPADITNNISNDGGKEEVTSGNDHFCTGAAARRRRETGAKSGRQWGGPNSPGLHIPLASLIQAVAVAEHLNFRHAASALGIAQSSVSARVKALEEDLGILLFERHTRGVRLTEAGRHFVERVATGIHHLDFAIRTAGMVARGEWGSLRVGVHALIPGSFLADLLESFRQQNPGIKIEISESTARASIMQLRAEQLDVAFVAGAPELPDYHSRRIWSERLMIALPSCHPLADQAGITWRDIACETFIVRENGTGPQVYDHIVMRLVFNSPNVSMLRFDVERGTLLSMVGQAYGLTVVGEASSSMQVPGVTFVPIIDEPEPFAFSAIWSPHNSSPAVRRLLDLAGKKKRSG